MNNFWKNRSVVVTGGEGFIGSVLTEELLRAGARVTVFAHYKPYGTRGHLSHLLDDIKIVSGDIRDAEQIREATKNTDTVFHLAALIGIPYSYAAPHTYVTTNVEGTRNVVAACQQNGVRRVVHTSTSEVYGTALSVPISEEHPLQPQSPYSATKIGADAIAMSYYHSYDTPVSICRPFNTYGPRQSARAIIPAVLQQLLSGVDELKVGSLTPTRDFTFVSDTAQGFMAIAESDKTVGRTLNLGAGEEISIGALIELLKKITQNSARVVHDPERTRPTGSEVHRLLADNRLVRSLTRWQPTVSLKDGLTQTAEWLALQPILRASEYAV
ncbi:GDP-mannose 4,6-dehydratase [Lysinibacter sp. HNR]|uniref:GDP-mannose 4,6-dehydratase n=1 Tax=Lysinibacter sp. HNR TaxID=3031408 RepID=UPI002435E153|nr:GDP-mannose 4,6-dehydratase [Lysinibacter sp. HNR]WGD37685.1 GDP-mannose 4,6-dehydratase [Lysinibacter sp. HNR]